MPLKRNQMNFKLKNPYLMVEDLNTLLKFYVRYSNSSSRLIFVRYFNYALYLAARVWGFIKLKRRAHSYLRAKYENGSSFTIRDTNSQFKSIYEGAYRDAYEPSVTAAIELFLKKGDVFVDIGSNWGHHSFYAVLEKGASAIAFEPNPVVAEDLARIADELGVNKSVEINRLALSDNNALLELKQHYFESGVASIDVNFSNDRAKEKYISIIHRLLDLKPITYEARAVPLDSLNLSKAELMKIDAEGVELRILRGAKRTIERLAPAICFEFHSGDLSKFEEFEKFFMEINYVIFEISVFRVSEVDPQSYQAQLKHIGINSLKTNTLYNLLAFHQSSERL